MNKKQGNPVEITKQNAVGIPTKDLDNMRLSFENRIQVFMGSGKDILYYSKIETLLQCNLPTIP